MPTATVVHIYDPRPTVTVVAFNIQEKESERISKVEIKTESKQKKCSLNRNGLCLLSGLQVTSLMS